VVDGEVDQGALDDGQFAVVVGPGGPALQLRVEAAPAAGGDVTEAVVGAGRLLGGFGVGGRLGQTEPGAVAGLASGVGSAAFAGRCEHHAVGADAAEQAYGFVAKEPGQAHDVVAGVQYEQDRRVALVPLPGPFQAFGQFADLCGGDLCEVVVGAQLQYVQRARPGGTAAAQGGGDLVGPAGNGLAFAVAAAGVVAVQASG
jgi:hypothetical protein